MGSPVEEAEAFLSFFRIRRFTAACLFFSSASHILDVQSAQKWHPDSLVHPGAPPYMQDWHFSWLSSSLRKWEHPGKVRCSLRSCPRGSDIPQTNPSFTYTVKTTNLRAQAWQAHVPKSKNGRLEGRQRIRINTIPQNIHKWVSPQHVVASEARGNRPLRCEASTRMREWMCYRNHLVRRRGSAHDTSGRCPFHITKFSPGRSCWARESYSCPEYLMERSCASKECETVFPTMLCLFEYVWRSPVG